MSTLNPDMTNLAACYGGQLPAFVWPGGYPLYYMNTWSEILCPDCANNQDNHQDPMVIVSDVHWEGEPLICNCCGALIESAYGPIEEETHG